MSTASEELVTSIDEPMTRLLAFEPSPFPVLSVYLNMQPDQHGRTPDTAPYLNREFKALARSLAASGPERESFEKDVERILAYAAKKIENAANGAAIFACWGAGEFFESIQLTAPIRENHVYVYNQPHLYQLALIEEQYPRYAAVLTDTNRARIFVFALGKTVDSEEVDGKKVHRVKVGGWSQARYQRRAENAHVHHAKEVIERLAEIVKEDRVSRIILSGDPVVVPLLREQLPVELAAITDVMKLDIHASEQDVFQATIEKLQEEDVKTNAEKVDRFLQQYRGRGLVVAGVEETLKALEQGQVDELLISTGLETGLEESVPDLLVTQAKQTSATVSFIEDSKLLEPVDGVGAFLRWRT
jgi:peptide subunit release factor 1 (eRF1)